MQQRRFIWSRRKRKTQDLWTKQTRKQEEGKLKLSYLLWLITISKLTNYIMVVSINKQEHITLRFFALMFKPLSWVIQAAAIMAMLFANGDGRQLFLGIVCLLIVNTIICYLKEDDAANVVAMARAGLSPKTKVLFIYSLNSSFFFVVLYSTYDLDWSFVCVYI